MSLKHSSYTSGHLEVSESVACLEKASFSYTPGHVKPFDLVCDVTDRQDGTSRRVSCSMRDKEERGVGAINSLMEKAEKGDELTSKKKKKEGGKVFLDREAEPKDVKYSSELLIERCHSEYVPDPLNDGQSDDEA
ncbi:hypothetical protein Tco_0072345 [Tanacetum coccineum]